MSTEPLLEESEEPVDEPASLSPFVPLLLLALVLAGWFTFQTSQLFRERDNLRVLRASQEQSVQESTKLRGSLDAIMHETAALAAQGSVSARLVVEGLAKRGITINPNSPTIRLSPPTP